MKKYIVTLGLLALAGSAQGQVLGKAISLQQTGICPVLGCKELKEVQISPRIKYIEGRKYSRSDYDHPPLGGGVMAFYVDGKLAALGWQEVSNYDSANIGMDGLNKLSKIGVGVGAPTELKRYIVDYSGPLGAGLNVQLEGKTFAAGNGVFKTIHEALDRRGILLIHRDYYKMVNDVIGRDDRSVAQALVKEFFKKTGISATKIDNYNYRIPYSRGILDQADKYFGNQKKMGNSACCGHPGSMFVFPGLSKTVIDFMPEYNDGWENSRYIDIQIRNGFY